MLVHDSAGARQVMTTLLTAAGMRVEVVHDPVLALQRLARSEPDVLLLDIETPRMDALSFLRTLRKNRDTPVVVCSEATGDRGDKAAFTLAQDESSSVVYGMPKAALDSGAVDTIAPLDRIGEEILLRC